MVFLVKLKSVVFLSFYFNPIAADFDILSSENTNSFFFVPPPSEKFTTKFFSNFFSSEMKFRAGTSLLLLLSLHGLKQLSSGFVQF